jgi:hypothetical protein
MYQEIPAFVFAIIKRSTGVTIIFRVFAKTGFNQVLMYIVYLLPKNFIGP